MVNARGRLFYSLTIENSYEKQVLLDESNEEELEMAKTDGTEIEVRLGMTLCLPKQYEMARCDVFVRLPGEKDNAESLANEAEEIAKNKLNELVARVSGTETQEV